MRRAFGMQKSLVVSALLLAALWMAGCGGPMLGEQKSGMLSTHVEQPKPQALQTPLMQHVMQPKRSHDYLPQFLPNLQNPAPAKGLIAHEWGTFTSVQSSNGKVLEGLHHEEEPLPDFVFKRARAGYGKGMEVAAEVTQKLETPVIYFYTPKAIKVEVEISFPKGIISEWFPNATSFTPKVNGHNTNQGLLVPANGKMTWNVELVPGLLKPPPTVDPKDIWAPSRQVPAATPVRFIEGTSPIPGIHGTYVKHFLPTQVEKFIFYRGIGKFDGWFKVKAQDDNTLELHNESTGVVPQVFLLRVANGKGSIKTLSAMKAGERRVVTVPEATDSMTVFVDKAASEVAAALVASGLYYKEAWAMVNTWRRSYFKSQTPGVRVLYVVPRADTDKLLPIKITPKPTQLVRTLVGRIEVLTPGVEAETIKLLRAGYLNKRTPALDLYGRFGEPRIRRACTQITDVAFHKYCTSIIAQMDSYQRYQQRTP